jgi:RNA polymerase sigma-70 factor (ECF subfamily)
LTPFPETRESLIVQVKDPSNRLAWERFVAIYQPVIYRIAIARGLQDADAHDLTQQVLMAVATALPRWERSSPSARFHHWLRRVTRNAIINAVTRRKGELATGSSSVRDLLDEIQQPEPATESLLELEVRRELYAIAPRPFAAKFIRRRGGLSSLPLWKASATPTQRQTWERQRVRFTLVAVA